MLKNDQHFPHIFLKYTLGCSIETLSILSVKPRSESKRKLGIKYEYEIISDINLRAENIFPFLDKLCILNMTAYFLLTLAKNFI